MSIESPDLVLGSDLLDDLEINESQLFALIEAGTLKPFSEEGVPLIRPDRRSKEQIEALKRYERYLLSRKYDLKNISRTDFYSEYLDTLEPHSRMMDFTIDVQVSNVRSQIKIFQSNNGEPDDWKNCALPDSKIEAKLLLKSLVSAYYQRVDVDLAKDSLPTVKSKSQLPYYQDNSLRKKLLPSQKHRLVARVVAKRNWAENPIRTIADMAKDPEIDKEYDGKRYSYKTLRSWIKDLCPTKKPGRRKMLYL